MPLRIGCAHSCLAGIATWMHEAIAECKWVAVRITDEGADLGEWLGIKPTGKRIQLRGINLNRVQAGLIVEHWGEAGTIGMLIQMGLDPFKQVAAV